MIASTAMLEADDKSHLSVANSNSVLLLNDTMNGDSDFQHVTDPICYEK